MKLAFKILFALMLLFTQAESQVKLGHTKSEILNDMPERNFFSGTTNSGYEYIYFQNESVIMHYYFDRNGMCDMSVLGMFKQSIVNGLVEQYNDQAVPVDNFNWKYYLKGGDIVYIKLKEVSGIMTFIYSFDPLD